MEQEKKDVEQQRDKLYRKRIEEIFREEGLKITTEINMVETDFLDVKLNLETHQYRPYRKPGDTPIYINVQSNHPPTIIKEVPKMVEKRLSRLSSTKEIFDEEIGIYQKALDDSGYKTKLLYNPSVTRKTKKSEKKSHLVQPTIQSRRQNKYCC